MAADGLTIDRTSGISSYQIPGPHPRRKRVYEQPHTLDFVLFHFGCLLISTLVISAYINPYFVLDSLMLGQSYGCFRASQIILNDIGWTCCQPIPTNRAKRELCANSCGALYTYPNSKVHGAHMGPIWSRQDPGGPHVGPKDFAIWVSDRNSRSHTISLHIWFQSFYCMGELFKDTTIEKKLYNLLDFE